MGNWKGWRCFKSLSIYTMRILSKVNSNFRFKHQGHRNGLLLSLYKDMESCGEYADIQVMWKMIESSSPQHACKKKRTNRSSYWV